MLRSTYNNFVRPSSSAEATASNTISGEEAKKIYLQEVNQVLEKQELLSNTKNHNTRNVSRTKHKRKLDNFEVSNLKLFRSVQDNNVDGLKLILDAFPDKINTVDEYGWSLLMIACQAKSYEAVKELLNRGVDTKIQDKAGNSAQSLIIRNKDSCLASILVDHTSSHDFIRQSEQRNVIVKEIKHKKRHKEMYVCKICEDKIFDNKQEHLSSTLHNINASKGKKIPTNYKIPQSNKGYQIMLKAGWKIETGLGPDGSGNRYPIKVVQKNDKKGLGLETKRVNRSSDESIKQQANGSLRSDYDRNRRFEINFRRQFY